MTVFIIRCPYLLSVRYLSLHLTQLVALVFKGIYHTQLLGEVEDTSNIT